MIGFHEVILETRSSEQWLKHRVHVARVAQIGETETQQRGNISATTKLPDIFEAVFQTEKLSGKIK